MREFNLDEAKRGVPVCTRDGHAARIICTNCQSLTPIVGLIYTYSEKAECAFEVLQSYDMDGRILGCDDDNNIDLFMQY